MEKTAISVIRPKKKNESNLKVENNLTEYQGSKL